MKKIILCFVVLLGLTNCSDQLTESELANPVQPVKMANTATIWRRPVGVMLVHT